MSPVVRVLVVVCVRLAFIFFAGWFAFHEGALGPDAPLVSRLGLVMLFLVASILVGELDRVRTHFGLLIGALRAAGGAGGGTAAAAAAAGLGGDGVPAPDPKASVDILVRALEAEDAGTRETAHNHLVRLTGKNLAADPALWQRWWQENRERWRPLPSDGNPPDQA